MQILTLITALPGAVAQGLIWGIMAIGVYITFRILDIADLTVDGTMCTGGAVCIMMMLSGHNVWIYLAASSVALSSVVSSEDSSAAVASSEASSVSSAASPIAT